MDTGGISSPIIAFSADQVADLTGLTKRQLAHWDRTGFYSPGLGTGIPRAAYNRVYSFRDLVNLRVLAILRNEHKVPLQQLRMLLQYLSRDGDQPWSRITFYVMGREVFYDDEELKRRMSGRRLGQAAIPFSMKKISANMAKKVERLRRRDSREIGRVEQNRYIMGNQTVVAGTRIPTSAIWNMVSAGYSEERILWEYPDLRPEDVAKAIEVERDKRKQRAG